LRFRRSPLSLLLLLLLSFFFRRLLRPPLSLLLLSLLLLRRFFAGGRFGFFLPLSSESLLSLLLSRFRRSRSFLSASRRLLSRSGTSPVRALKPVPALLGAVSALEPAGAAPGPDPVPCDAAPLVTGAALSRAAMSRALAIACSMAALAGDGLAGAGAGPLSGAGRQPGTGGPPSGCSGCSGCNGLCCMAGGGGCGMRGPPEGGGGACAWRG